MDLHGASQAPQGRFNLPSMRSILYGAGCVRQHLADEVRALGAKRALLVTGKTLYTQTSLVRDVRDALGPTCVGVFADTVKHVPRTNLMDLLGRVRSLDADLVISFGGGSAIDLAKLAVMALSEDVRASQDLDRLHVQYNSAKMEVPPLCKPTIPHLTISTTLSAGEFTDLAGCTDTVRSVKHVYRGPALVPRAIFLDPEVTVATPGLLWGATGVRALDHAIEGICSRTPSALFDVLGLRAIELLFASLVPASREPNDLVARAQCQLAAWFSIFAMGSVTTGLSHDLVRRFGARTGSDHGLTSCVLLPAVMDFNWEVTTAQQTRIGEAMGPRAKGVRPSDALRALVRELGAPARLRDLGVQRQDLASIAQDAAGEWVARANPRPVQNSEELLSLLEAVY